jgi:hypothetical protein
VSRCTLQLGDTVVLVAQGGPPEAEYALFDLGEIELLATEPGRIREIGYRTVVAHARARLAESGITPKSAEDAATSFGPGVARAYSRGAAVRRIVDQLGAAELFDGRMYDAATGTYAGHWLDLGALGGDLRLPRAPALLQAMHLAALLAEYDDDVPLVLATSQVSAARRPGERTFRRVSFDDPGQLANALRALRPPPEREGSEAGPTRQEILTWVRDRAAFVPACRERLAGIKAVLETREPPTRGPLADGELWALETKLAAGEIADVAERLDAFERRRGRLPGTMYLRARLALMTGSEEPGAIADRVSALSTSMAAFHELHLLAAQAWAAAGDARRARAFARDLIDNKTASDTLQMNALDVLEAVGHSSNSLTQPSAPASAQSSDRSMAAGRPRDSVPAGMTERVPGPPGSALPGALAATTPSAIDHATIPTQDAPSTPRLPMGSSWPPPSARAPDMRTEPSELRRTIPDDRSLPMGASLPPYRVESPTDGEPRDPAVPPTAGAERGENLESLSLPPDVRDEPPPFDELPSTPSEARLAFTYLARELARNLRVRHGVELRCDVDGLELAQRHLREAMTDGRIRSAEDEREVMRNGAFVAELLARRLGARWVDLGSPEPGAWAMLVACRSRSTEVVRVWPIGRVMRFLAMGHRERDLVSYYLDLEARTR